MEGEEIDLDYEEDMVADVPPPVSAELSESNEKKKKTEDTTSPLPSRFPSWKENVSKEELAAEDGLGREERRQRVAFGIPLNAGEARRKAVSSKDVNELYRDLSWNDSSSLNVIVVKGCDGMTSFAVERIFAKYRPMRLEMSDDATAMVTFKDGQETAEMMIGMTKAMRRVRAKKTADEEGEVLSSGDEGEEGQLMEEHGDDVAVMEDDEPRTTGTSKKRGDVVEIDVNEVKIPDGRWRVVCEHVPENRLMLARFATRKEVLASRRTRPLITAEEVSLKRRVADTDDDSAWGNGKRVRPGLNIFNDRGEELEWDYAHDTRFYDDKELTTGDGEASVDKVPSEEVTKGAPQAVKVKGRGAKKGRFLYGAGGGTLASDDAAQTKRASSSRLASDDASWDASPVSSDDEDNSPSDRFRHSRLGDRLQRRH